MEKAAIHHCSRLARNRFILASLLATTVTLGETGTVQAQEQGQVSKPAGGLTTLITKTPEEGFALAVKLSQKGVSTTQTDASVRKSLRTVYAHDPDSLIAASQVIAINFQTIAAANNYWRD